MKWRWASEVQSIGERLIRDVPDHQLLVEARIDWLFMDSVPMSHGRRVLGRARRVSGWAAFLSQGPAEASEYQTPVPFFAVEIAEPTWHELKDHQKRALVDHELCHLVVDLDEDPPGLRVRGHDFEEFAAVIRRNGLWSAASAGVAMALAEQLSLAVDDVVSFVADLGSAKPDVPAGVDPATGEIFDDGGTG